MTSHGLTGRLDAPGEQPLRHRRGGDGQGGGGGCEGQHQVPECDDLCKRHRAGRGGSEARSPNLYRHSILLG